MRFSERRDYKAVKDIIQTEEISEKLRNSLWNYFYKNIFAGDVFARRIDGLSFGEYTTSPHYAKLLEFGEEICSSFLKIPYNDKLIENPSINFSN